MQITGTEFGRRLMKVVGAQMGVTYLSVPITTGYRDLQLMRELGVSKQELRERFGREHRERVIGPNEREAEKYAQMVRRLGLGRLVINPGDLYVPDWTQADYLGFWEEAIRSFALEVVLAPGWVFSDGSRFEVGVCLQSMVPIMDLYGRQLTPQALMEMDRRARSQLLGEGFSHAQIASYMPWVDFVGKSMDAAHFSEGAGGFADIAARHNDRSQRGGDETRLA